MIVLGDVECILFIWMLIILSIINVVGCIVMAIREMDTHKKVTVNERGYFEFVGKIKIIKARKIGKNKYLWEVEIEEVK